VITADVNDLELEPDSFDRVVSIEMFEHLNNWQEMLRRISSWVRPDGRVFIHVFTHAPSAYLTRAPGRPSASSQRASCLPHDLLLHFQDELELRERWIVDGTHYSRTLAAWLERLDDNRQAALDVLRGVHGDERSARVALANWRLFLLSCTEIWGYHEGSECSSATTPSSRAAEPRPLGPPRLGRCNGAVDSGC